MKRLILLAIVLAVGGCAELEEMMKPPPPVISEISESHLRIQSNQNSWAEIEQVARRGCATYQRVPVYISTQCGAFMTHATPRECAGGLGVGAPGAVAALNHYLRLECQRKLDHQRRNPTCIRDDHLFACQ